MDKDKNRDKPDIVEGEILDQAPQSDGDLSKEAGKNAGPNERSKKGPSRIPWILFTILLAFIGGLFMEPWFETGIERLFPGTMPQKENAALLPDPKMDQNANDIKSLQGQISELKALVESGPQDRCKDIKKVFTRAFRICYGERGRAICPTPFTIHIRM